MICLYTYRQPYLCNLLVKVIEPVTAFLLAYEFFTSLSALVLQGVGILAPAPELKRLFIPSSTTATAYSVLSLSHKCPLHASVCISQASLYKACGAGPSPPSKVPLTQTRAASANNPCGASLPPHAART